MKITQDVRDYAEGLSDNEKTALYPEARTGTADEAARGMAEMSKKFVDMGANVYVEADAVKASNKVL